MLRQLLSSTGEAEVSKSQMVVDFSPTSLDYVTPSQQPPTTYLGYPPGLEYVHYASTPAPITLTNVSPNQANQAYPPPPGHAPVDAFSAPTSTADLYSSTYAMLSSDGSCLFPPGPDWITYAPAPGPGPPVGDPTKGAMGQYNPNPPPVMSPYGSAQPNQPYPDQVYAQVQPVYPQPIFYSYDPATYPSTSTGSPQLIHPETRPRKSSGGISARSAQAAFSESFRKVANIPSGTPNSGTGTMDDDDCVRVMCLACKGVYPSRRSLTGHIGRNEKCREIIGRTYLDSLAQSGQAETLPDPSAMEGGGISPVCPNCDRFISHYRGNIRRHINQCVKRPSKGSPLSSTTPTGIASYSNGQHSPNSVKSISQHYASMAPVVPKDDPAYHHPALDSDADSTFFDGTVAPVTNHLNSTPGKVKPAKGTSSVAVIASNPYSCSWCKFTTVYKGNMKRHLISVHNCTDELLRRISFDLETLRALAPNRPVTPLAPMGDRIRGASGRRRRSRSKTERDDSKRAHLLADDEVPPAAVCDVIASFASPTKYEHVAASHDSGISSGSSVDEPAIGS